MACLFVNYHQSSSAFIHNIILSTQYIRPPWFLACKLGKIPATTIISRIATVSGCEFLKLGVEKLLITIDELRVKLSVCFSLNLCVGPFSLWMVFVSSTFLFLSPKIKIE